MARIPLMDKKETLPPEHHGIYDAIAQSRGQVRGPFATLLHSPQIAERTAHLGTYIRFESQLDPKIIELTATIGYYAMLACTLNAFEVVSVTPPEDLRI